MIGAERYRTHTCLGAAGATGEVRLAGWVHRRRDHGGLIFVDLRDRSGILQLVVDPETAGASHELAESLHAEDVLSVVGAVVARGPGTVNPRIPTGTVELRVTAIERLAAADPLPFSVEDESIEASEELRLAYRYLDMRRPRRLAALELRSRVTRATRNVLDTAGFLEVETPVLTRSTPEGARDFLVPSRLQRGSWYALPQSPQLFKQLLMVGGIERYFQIVRCFRDEDLRSDRQPEFTQVDIEASFVEPADIQELVETILVAAFAEADVTATAPFPRITHADAMERYGTDRPDVRYGLPIVDLTSAAATIPDFAVFARALAAGGAVAGIVIPGVAPGVSRKVGDELVEEAVALGAKGLVWGAVEPDGSLRGPAAKFLSGLPAVAGASPGDLLVIVADERAAAWKVLGMLRTRLAERFALIPDGAWALTWVTDFPLVDWNADERRWDSTHHPFTAPHPDDMGAIADDPGSARSLAYDIVLNGMEIGGGSIRIHDRDVQSRVFELIGLDAEAAEAKFGFLLRALKLGAPPHGGIALGLDRIVMLLAGERSIRDVIAFPKTATGADPLTGAPSDVDAAQLRELGITAITTPGVPG